MAADELYNTVGGNAWPGSVVDPASRPSACGSGAFIGEDAPAPSGAGASSLMGDGVEATVKVDRWLLLGLAALLAVYLYFQEG